MGEVRPQTGGQSAAERNDTPMGIRTNAWRVATGRTAGKRTWRIVVVLCLAWAVGPSVSSAEGEGAKDIWEALTKGKPTLNVRGRIEVAKAQNLNQSEAYTVRTRIGYGTKPYHGVRIYMNFENIAAATETTYFNPNFPPNSNRLTPIADPPGTEVNVGFLEFDRPDWLGTKFLGGRQAIVLDDSRFIGDVAWRQNQQTMDAAYLTSSVGVEYLKARYGFIGHVNRIFGGGGNNPALSDFDSESHIVNVSYDRFEAAKLVGFAYWLDLRLPGLANPSANSSQTYGVRATGKIGLSDQFSLPYQGSYAYQQQYAGKTPNYRAHYGLADLGLQYDPLGKVGAGFGLLGSDNGTQQFLTPLSTAHKFNGWAHVFLDNGGGNGLRDLYVYAAPKLPWKLHMRLVYHRFWSDSAGTVLGNEFDGQIGRPIGKFVSVLFKSGYFVAANGSPRPTTYRVWLDLNIKF